MGKQYEGDSFQPIVKDTFQTVKQAGVLKKDIREKVTFLADFIYDRKNDSYTCPNGKTLSRYTKSSKGTYHGVKYRTHLGACKMCALRNKCLIKNGSRRTIFISKPLSKHESYAKKMMDIIDSA